MNLDKYKDYRRIYPKLRVSWSLYKLWVKKDWMAVWDYLTDAYAGKGENQIEGTRVHKWIEDNGWKAVTGIEEYLSMDGYQQEIPIVLERDTYAIVARPDLCDKGLVADWKTGKSSGYEQQLQEYMWVISQRYNSNCQVGLLIEIKAQYKGEEIIGVIIKRVKQYEKSKHADEWEDRFYEMANDIQLNYNKLDKYLNFRT